MLSRWARTWLGKLLRPLLLGIDKLGIEPDALTIGGLVAETIAGVFFAIGEMGWALAALIAGQFLDTLDGELARLHGRGTSFGAFLDSICDHYGDFAVYLGLLWHAIGVGSRPEIVLIVIALFGSVFGSLVRSRASMAGVDTKTIGIFTRFERTLVLLAGVLAGRLDIALWLLAIFNNFSALQRIFHTVRTTNGSEDDRRVAPIAWEPATAPPGLHHGPSSLRVRRVIEAHVVRFPYT